MPTRLVRLLPFLLLTLALPAVALAVGLDNPLGTTNPHVIIGRLIRAILGLSGTAALVVFVYGGFLWLTSAGDPKKVEKGKEAIKWAVLGIAFIFISYTLVNALIGVIATGTAA